MNSLQLILQAAAWAVDWIRDNISLFTASGILVAIYQLRKNIRWNRLSATFTYFNTDSYMKQEAAASKAIKDLISIELHQTRNPISDDQAIQIWNDPPTFREVRLFLNVLETYALAYYAGAIDADCAYKLRADTFIRYYNIFHPLIKKARKELDNDSFYRHLEALAEDFKNMRMRNQERLRWVDRVRRRY